MSKAKKITVHDIALISVFVAVISICSYICIPFAFPFTLQIFGVFCAVGILGVYKGSVSVFVYLALGLVGVPVFSGFQGGFQKLLEPTGGFLIGFLVAALISGLFIKVTGKTLASMLFGLFCCYVCEIIWLCVVSSFNMYAAIFTVTPFIIPDIIKTIAASVISVRIKKAMDNKNGN